MTNGRDSEVDCESTGTTNECVESRDKADDQGASGGSARADERAGGRDRVSS